MLLNLPEQNKPNLATPESLPDPQIMQEAKADSATPGSLPDLLQ